MTNLQKLLDEYKDEESSMAEGDFSDDYGNYDDCYNVGFQHGYARACQEIAVMLPVEYKEK